MVLNIHIGQPNILSNFHSYKDDSCSLVLSVPLDVRPATVGSTRSAGCLARGSADLQSAAFAKLNSKTVIYSSFGGLQIHRTSNATDSTEHPMQRVPPNIRSNKGAVLLSENDFPVPLDVQRGVRWICNPPHLSISISRCA